MTTRRAAVVKRSRKPRGPLEYSDLEAMDAALTAPTAVAMFARLPGPKDTGRSRDYPESVIKAVPGDRRLKALRNSEQEPIRAFHYRYAARTWLKEVLEDLKEAFRGAAAELAQQLGQCTVDGPSTPNLRRQPRTSLIATPVARLHAILLCLSDN